MNYYFGRGWARSIPYLLLLPGIFLYVLVALGPSLATGVYSFTDATGIRGGAIHWVGLENYNEFLLLGQRARENIDIILLTLKFCFFVSIIQFVLGLLVAMLLNQRLKGTNFFRTIIFLPVILGVTIQGLMWQLFLYPLGGPVDRVLEFFDIQAQFLGGPPDQAIAWVIVVQIWANLGITMVIFLAGLQTIPDELVEAARIDGANGWQAFWNITWPLLTPSVNTNMILNIIGSLQAWQLFFVLIGYRVGARVLGYTVFAEGFGRTSGSMRLG